MPTSLTHRWQKPLVEQLRWFLRLRWVAAGAVIAGGLLNWRWLDWWPHGLGMVIVGLVILAYNFGLWAILRVWSHTRQPRSGLLALAWAQIIADLVCLTLLTIWTGGTSSPLAGFYVFHMVFASVLLPRSMAYAGAGLAVILLESALFLTSQWPRTWKDCITTIAWGIMLLGTVHLANHITRALQRQRRRLMRQNVRVRALARKLREQQDRMVQQEKMVAMGQMAAGVAHEIANPLASMDSLLQLMDRRPEKATPSALASLRDQIARINGIVRQMTTFAHRGEGQWEPARLDEIVDKALEVVRFDPRAKRVRIERQSPLPTPEILMVPAALQQVIINLVINALDALENQPQPALTIRTALEGDFCTARISDNGHGIAPEHQARIFEPFFTTKPVGKGTGLGLSISYSMVRKHGGTLEVQSAPGQGATFLIRLPARTASRKREEAQGAIANSEKPLL